jgi:uncharacterized protein (TIGR02391 family)
LDKKIKDYADSIYDKEMMQSITLMQTDISDFLMRRTARNPSANLPFGGADVQNVLGAHLRHIERCMAIRVGSYQRAFDEAKEIPSEEDLVGVMQSFQSERERQIRNSTANLKGFFRARDAPPFTEDLTGSLTEASARSHDNTLREWKAWRDKSRIQRGTPKTVKAPILATGEEYMFHPQIEEVSRRLYQDGHFKQAVFEAFVSIINRVKDQANLHDLDNEKLMNNVFGQGGGGPRIRFNSLSTQAERDEQTGIMNLFKGICGIRNFKAHTNVLFDSPERGHEYLALASLLMRLLDIATVNTTRGGVAEAAPENA